MTIASTSDLDIQTLVRDELDWSPDVDEAGIGVSVEDGAVTLSGEVDSYAERLSAKRAALRVRGVRTVVDALSVRPTKDAPPNETEVAREVDHALKIAANVPDSVQAEVTGHNVTLIGQVEWEFQRNAAQRVVQYLRGVYTVSNLIMLKARPSAPDTEERIRKAIERNALLDARTIHVQVDGNTVTLTGTVRSWAESTQAADAAWASPHVTDVDNQIVVKAW